MCVWYCSLSRVNLFFLHEFYALKELFFYNLWWSPWYICKAFLVVVSFDYNHTRIREYVTFLLDMPCRVVLVVSLPQCRGMLIWERMSSGQVLLHPLSSDLFLKCPWVEWIICLLNLLHFWLCPCWVVWWIVVESAYCIDSCKFSRAESVTSHVSFTKWDVCRIYRCNWNC